MIYPFGTKHYSLSCKAEPEFAKTYQGEWKEDQWSGPGTLRSTSGTFYSGGFRHGLKHGKGKETYYCETTKNGEYQGQFFNDERHGCGTFTYPNGMCSVREYKYGTCVSEHVIKLEDHKKQQILDQQMSALQEQKSLELSQLRVQREELMNECDKLKNGLANEREEFRKQKGQFEEDTKTMEDIRLKQSTIIKLNVGGTKYTTSRETLIKYKDSMLGKMFGGQWKQEKDEEGCYFIDRDGASFKYILRFLQNGEIKPPSSSEELYQLKQETEYFLLPDLTK